MSSLKIEIYGIPEEVSRCPGCALVRKTLDDLKIPYEFYPVFKNSSNELGFEYDRPRIVEVAKRIGCYPSLALRYPIVFMNNQKIHKISILKDKLRELGYDPD
jgi:glutaredoxin